MHLVNGTGNSPSQGQPTPGVVKQDKSSGGSFDTTKTRLGPQRVRMSSGERPLGATKGKQSDTEALCQPPHHPPPQPRPLWYISVVSGAEPSSKLHGLGEAFVWSLALAGAGAEQEPRLWAERQTSHPSPPKVRFPALCGQARETVHP